MSPLATWLIVIAALSLWALLWAPTATRRRRVETSADINRDPQTVFALVGDLRNLPSFWPEVESVEMLTDGPVRVGSRFRVRTISGRLLFIDMDEILEYRPPTAVTWRVDGYTPSVEMLTLEGDGKTTRVLHRSESVEKYFYALYGVGLVAPILNWTRLRDRRLALRRLKEVLEVGAPN